jgi:hypothetical protein
MRATPDHRSAAEGGHNGVVRRSTFRRVKCRIAKLIEATPDHKRPKSIYRAMVASSKP